MKARKFLCAVIFTFILAGESYPAQKGSNPDRRARIIYELFTGVNPNLSASDAKNYSEIVIEAAEKFNQDPYVIAGIIVHESTVNRKAVSSGGDYGLMQVRWKVHEKAIKQRFSKVRRANDMFDARTNIFFGTEIFRDCMRKSDGDFRKGLLRYSAGNTKLRDKVTATVKSLQAKDSAQKVNFPKNNLPKNNAPQNNVPQNSAPQNNVPQNNAPKDPAPQNNIPKRHQPKSEAERAILLMLEQITKKEK